MRAVPRMQAFVTRVCNILLPQTDEIAHTGPVKERMQRALMVLGGLAPAQAAVTEIDGVPNERRNTKPHDVKGKKVILEMI